MLQSGGWLALPWHRGRFPGGEGRREAASGPRRRAFGGHAGMIARGQGGWNGGMGLIPFKSGSMSSRLYILPCRHDIRAATSPAPPPFHHLNPRPRWYLPTLPDHYALYTAEQVQRGRPREGQVLECGVVEVKGVGDDAWLTADSEQVSCYWDRYRLVLVTNLRDFVLVGADGAGVPARLETFRLAQDADDFWSKVERPRAFARAVGAGLGEYLARALSHRAALAEPKDLAWLLASYAWDGLARRRGGGGGSVAADRPVGAGGAGGDPVQGRARRPLLPLDISLRAWVDSNYRPHAYQVSPSWRESRQGIV